MVLVDCLDTVVSEGYYVYGRGDSIFIKEVRKMKDRYGVWYGPNDTNIPDETWTEDEIRIIGRVKWMAREIK
jgi:phage repressor protein C with HTH and peptisase S24 domain